MVKSNQRTDGALGKPSASQAEAIAFLSDPNSFDPPGCRVTRIDTHAAIVFLAGDFAYKIKRAVAYSYLNFSTLEKRGKVCEHELRRNRTAAPEIYIDVVPIVRTASGTLALNGPGRPIEWVVRMARFDQEFLFDQMAERGTLKLDHMVSLADVIAKYHARAPRGKGTDFDASLGEVLTSTVTSLTSGTELLGLHNVRRYANATVRLHNEVSSLLRSRARHGYVRLCHGDLHLQNIVLFEGKPTLFDAIEFDDEIATIDVLFDLAFVLMDLWKRNLKAHANVLFNGYMNHPAVEEDLQGLALLPLFLALRAATRAMVTLDRLSFVDTRAQRIAAEHKIKGYFKLANSILRPEKPVLIAVGGRSGTGKTTIASAIAPQIGRAPGAIHVRTDIERKRLFKVAVDHRLGPEAYTPEVSKTVYRKACDKAAGALRAGHSVIIDAVFLGPENRALIAQTAREAGAGFKGIWLDASADHLIQRVKKREGDASDAGAAVVRSQLAIDPGAMSWLKICADGRLDDTVDSVAEVLALPADALKQVSLARIQ